MKYHDYYNTLGVERTASADEIHKAYRKLARQYHPDVNKAKGAEDRIKQINEAHEVLKDQEKRSLYDRLGNKWQDGQDFRPPPGFENIFQDVRFKRGGNGRRFSNQETAFSDFFSSLFGDLGGGFHAGFESSGFESRAPEQNAEAEITIPLETVYKGGNTRIEVFDQLQTKNTRSYDVNIPPGTTEGTRLRLPQTGLSLRIRIAKDSKYSVEKFDLIRTLAVTPWEAGLGAKIEVLLYEGSIQLKIPEGSSSGTRLRVRGKGLRKKDGSRGDLYVELQIQIPKRLSTKERQLFEKLQAESSFNPR